MDEFFKGKETQVILPDTSKVTIREVNGEDEAVLSKISNMKDGSNIHAFLAGIITQPEGFMVHNVAAWPVNNIFYLIFKQRLINLGNQLKFKEECQQCDDGIEYEFDEDVTEYDNIKLYPNGEKRIIDLTISSKKTLRYKILTGDLQKKQLDIPQDALNKNSNIIARELEIYNAGQWTPVKYFGNYSSKEMQEIRSHIKINDPLFDPIIKYKCPKCKSPGRSQLFNISSFYWPEEVI